MPGGADTMTVDQTLIDRLSTEADRRMTARAREGRTRALESISRVMVTVTRDGADTWDEVFDRPPTLAQLVARVGESSFVVGVRMQRKALSERFRQKLRAA